jgi:hypothetical protein
VVTFTFTTLCLFSAIQTRPFLFTCHNARAVTPPQPPCSIREHCALLSITPDTTRHLTRLQLPHRVFQIYPVYCTKDEDMGRKPKREPSPEKPHRLTLAQLAAYDDVCTDVMVDNAYSKLFTVRKYGTKGNKYNPIRGVKEDDVPQILLHKLIVAKDFMAAEKALWKLPGVRNYRLRLAPAEMADFREHFDKYVDRLFMGSFHHKSLYNNDARGGGHCSKTNKSRRASEVPCWYTCSTHC